MPGKLNKALHDKQVVVNFPHCCSLLFFWVCPQALIPLALEGTEAGKVKACHALAKIASISNPEIAFPGERVNRAAIAAFYFY